MSAAPMYVVDPSMLPSVDRALRMPGMESLVIAHGHALVSAEVRRLLADWRQGIAGGNPPTQEMLRDAAIVARVANSVAIQSAPALRPVFNLTGTILHTNLGRALLCDAAVEATVQSARWPVNVEFD